MTQRYNVFSLPPELIETLTPRTLGLISRTPAREPTPTPSVPQIAPSANSRGCNICLGSTFFDVDEQRSHFRSDWHRYNVKVRLSGGNPVSESIFTKLVEDLEDSLSGSASSDESSDESDAVSALVSKINQDFRVDSPDEDLRGPPVTPVSWFHSPPATQIGVYRMLFPLGTPPSSYLSELKNMQIPVEGGRKWAVFMVAGGHFAGAVARVSNSADEQHVNISGKARKKPLKGETEVLKHKTFHRYTTRRKQGGSQSLNDNAKGPAKSAGAMLRRYGEQSLRDDIRGLLQDWAEDIHECERIWIRASVSNRRIFLDYEDCIIAKGDGRLRTFPFPTRRPVCIHSGIGPLATQSELARCLQELTRVKISHLSEDALRAQDEAYLASISKPKSQPIQTVPEPERVKSQRLTKEEELEREKWTRLLDMISKGRLEPLKTFWEREAGLIGGVDTPVPDWTGERRSSLLQVAAQSGHEDVVRWLLCDLHADPCTQVSSAWTRLVDAGNESDASDTPTPPPGSGRTAYDLTRSRAVRDVFRRCAADHPDWWDWFGAAHVPSALTKQKEEERDDKKKQRRKGLREKMREREARERQRGGDTQEPEPVIEPPKLLKQPTSGPQRLGGASGAADGIVGLTPEMRAKVERERRARAAEARLKHVSGR
ncbi:hypothetical protein F5I97DRAFT_1798663 [Phlebopus sp. FC_14]|nr:hypothetical protein F5I97DRAFT_1798663 [Phlebopus sp. FC_14]